MSIGFSFFLERHFKLNLSESGPPSIACTISQSPSLPFKRNSRNVTKCNSDLYFSVTKTDTATLHRKYHFTHRFICELIYSAACVSVDESYNEQVWIHSERYECAGCVSDCCSPAWHPNVGIAMSELSCSKCFLYLGNTSWTITLLWMDLLTTCSFSSLPGFLYYTMLLCNYWMCVFCRKFSIGLKLSKCFIFLFKTCRFVASENQISFFIQINESYSQRQMQHFKILQ